MNKVLVILATFNGEKYIEDQIRSIINQKGVEITIFVYDDKSNDKTVSIINGFSDSRIKIFQNTVNSGSPALNFINSIKSLDEKLISEFDYFSLSDQDDIWFENKIYSALDLIKKNKSSLYCSNLIKWDDKKNTTSIINKHYPQKKFDYLFEGASAGCTYVLDRKLFFCIKKCINSVVNWDNKYLSHDWFIYFYARHYNFKVIIDKRPFLKYRIHQNNVHGSLNSNSLTAIIKRLSLIKHGWFIKQINFFSQFLDNDSVEKKIYQKFSKGYFSRILVLLKYNFSLFRSPLKFLKFFFINLFLNPK
jgi:rhamnosyltransferase